MFELKPFQPYPDQTPALETVPLPADLPEPVARYYRVTCGERLPVITSAVISGRGPLRFKGITFPARFRFSHQAGQNYRHYLEAAVLGRPVMKVNEHYLDGHSRLELPFGVVENSPEVDQAANLGLWGESIWLPSIFITDPRVRWEAIDATSARLVVPFGAEEDSFTVTFDPQSGRLVSLLARRYQNAGDTEKTPWLNEVRGWQTFHGLQIPSSGAVTWQNEGRPWAIFNVEEVVYNVDLSDYIRARGP